MFIPLNILAGIIFIPAWYLYDKWKELETLREQNSRMGDVLRHHGLDW